MRKPLFYYFLTDCGRTAYRAVITVSRKQKALGQFTIAKQPEMFTPDGWTKSLRFDGGLEGQDSFQANIDAGALRRATMLEACAKVNGDVVLFAPTLSSRIANKANKHR